MIRDNLAPYKTLYVETAREYLKSIKTALVDLKISPENKELINQVYIGAHSLKSQSVVMGFAHTGFLCHTIEYIFHEVKEGKILISLPLLQLISSAVTKLENGITTIERDDREVNMTENIRDLEKIILKVNHI